MKRIFKAIIFPIWIVLLFVSCEDEVSRPDSWPEWPNLSQPKFENTKFTDIEGNPTVEANSLFKFSTRITDAYNELEYFSISITVNNQVILEEKRELNGLSTDIELEGRIPFVANFGGDIKPEVKLKAVNSSVNGVTELILPEAENITVTRPTLPLVLYIVDNQGQTFELKQLDGKQYNYATDTSLKNIGSSFKIAAKLTQDNKIDYNGVVWGLQNNEIACVNDDSGESIGIQDPNEDTRILFNAYSFLISGTVPSTIVDLAKFSTSPFAGLKQMILSLNKGEEIEFRGFGNEIAKVTRPEYFVNTIERKANFDGLAGEYILYYNEANGFLYTESTSITYPNLILLIGVGMGFPQTPYIASSAWNFTPDTSIQCKKVGDGIFQAVMYMSEGFDFKMFVAKSWVWPNSTPPNVVSGIYFDSRWNSAPFACEYQAQDFNIQSTQLIKAHDWNGDLVPGNAFTPGVYEITINIKDGVKSIALKAVTE